MVSLAECELRSKTWKTSRLPNPSTTNATATPATFSFIIQETVTITV
jgi:hypothetical protein